MTLLVFDRLASSKLVGCSAKDFYTILQYKPHASEILCDYLVGRRCWVQLKQPGERNGRNKRPRLENDLVQDCVVDQIHLIDNFRPLFSG